MDKQRQLTCLVLNLRSTGRAEVRAEIFQYWINESPGTPTLRNLYRYEVEHLRDGSQIYLTRPTRLNKGADFVIYCQNFTRFLNGNDKPPKHKDLIRELEALVATSPEHKREILAALRRIWSCEPSALVISGLRLFANEARAERVLLLAKWFFIEQDVTYWTESGRHMLRGEFERHFGLLP